MLAADLHTTSSTSRSSIFYWQKWNNTACRKTTHCCQPVLVTNKLTDHNITRKLKLLSFFQVRPGPYMTLRNLWRLLVWHFFTSDALSATQPTLWKHCMIWLAEILSANILVLVHSGCPGNWPSNSVVLLVVINCF